MSTPASIVPTWNELLAVFPELANCESAARQAAANFGGVEWWPRHMRDALPRLIGRAVCQQHGWDHAEAVGVAEFYLVREYRRAATRARQQAGGRARR